MNDTTCMICCGTGQVPIAPANDRIPRTPCPACTRRPAVTAPTSTTTTSTETTPAADTAPPPPLTGRRRRRHRSILADGDHRDG